MRIVSGRLEKEKKSIRLDMECNEEIGSQITSPTLIKPIRQKKKSEGGFEPAPYIYGHFSYSMTLKHIQDQ